MPAKAASGSCRDVIPAASAISQNASAGLVSVAPIALTAIDVRACSSLCFSSFEHPAAATKVKNEYANTLLQLLTLHSPLHLCVVLVPAMLSSPETLNSEHPHEHIPPL